MLFKIIDNNEDWDKVLAQFNNTDVYYAYPYGKLFEEKEQARLLGVYFEYKASRLFYPFLLRSIAYLPGNFYDIVTPYGYGGPLVEGDPQVVEAFYQYFRLYCKDRNIITETIRFHPLLENHQYVKDLMTVPYIRKTTAVDLTQTLEEIRNGYTSSNKRNIKKAQKNGLVCREAEKTSENISLFHSLYKETMDRNEATTFYYFDQVFFEKQLEDCSYSKAKLLFVWNENEVIAGAILLIGNPFAHYHLGASKTDYLSLRPNNLLFDFMVEISKGGGASILHLGGGYAENDGLFAFKSSFTNGNHYDFYLGKKVYNDEVYEELNELAAQKYKLSESYFPRYRGIL
jgi:hypothetical protein